MGGVPTIQPYLQPLRAEPAINFLKRAFGAEDLARYTAPDGVVHHAMLKIGDSHLEMGEARGPYQPMKSMFCLYVPEQRSAAGTETGPENWSASVILLLRAGNKL